MVEIDPLALEIQNLSLAYNPEKLVLKNLQLTIAQGEIGCLIGHSAGGKTTLLRAIAGMLPIATGYIKINGKVVSSLDTHVPTVNRKVGMFFQDYALFPHLTVEKNIGFGLFNQEKSVKKSRIEFLLTLLDLHAVADFYPHEISGGQQQRVAFARALAPQPQMLLLDEPFSNLDPELRECLVFEVRNILKKTATTTLVVTHDQKEAFAIGDKIGVMLGGTIRQWGSSQDLYHNPVNRFVADFVGEGAILPGRLLADDLVEIDLGKIKPATPLRNCPVSTVEVLLRPDDLYYQENSPQQGTLVFKAFQGSYYLYTLQLDSGYKVYMFVSSWHRHEIGQKIGLCLKNRTLTVFPSNITKILG